MTFFSDNVSRTLQDCRYCIEGHSVERIYLRQRSSDGSVSKTILKPRLALAARRQLYVYVRFPEVKFRVAVQLAGSLGKAAKFRSLYSAV